MNDELYYKKFSFVMFITPSKFDDPTLILDDNNYNSEVNV